MALGWTYGANGNRLTQTGASPSTYTISGTSNRITSISGTQSRTYSYDAMGNTTGYTAATATYNNPGRQLWDWLNPPPRGGGRHAKEIGDLWRAYANCQALHKVKCEGCLPESEGYPVYVPLTPGAPVPAPAPVPIRPAFPPIRVPLFVS
jgi:hypothetical protein